MSDSINEQRCKHDHRQALRHDMDEGGRCRCCGIERGMIGSFGLCPGPSVVTPPAQDEQLIGIVRAVLAEHWLFDIGCDHDAETNAPVCACCQVNLGTHSTVAGARDAWIAHVMEQIEETSRG